MTWYGRSSGWAAALVLGLAVLIGGSPATAPAARSGTSAFELTLTPPWGTFASRAPFCTSGRFAPEYPGPWSGPWRFTCDDGSGSLTVGFGRDLTFDFDLGESSWQIIDGSGSYAGFRGKGSLQLCGESCDFAIPIPMPGTLLGEVDRDAVAPTIAITSARVAKLRRPAGAYSIRLALALRDGLEGNPVSYTLRVTTAGGTELALRIGTARKPTLPLTMRVEPRNERPRAVFLRLGAEDPFGNASSLVRRLNLPR